MLEWILVREYVYNMFFFFFFSLSLCSAFHLSDVKKKKKLQLKVTKLHLGPYMGWERRR